MGNFPRPLTLCNEKNPSKSSFNISNSTAPSLPTRSKKSNHQHYYLHITIYICLLFTYYYLHMFKQMYITYEPCPPYSQVRHCRWLCSHQCSETRACPRLLLPMPSSAEHPMHRFLRDRYEEKFKLQVQMYLPL